MWTRRLAFLVRHLPYRTFGASRLPRRREMRQKVWQTLAQVLPGGSTPHDSLCVLRMNKLLSNCWRRCCHQHATLGTYRKQSTLSVCSRNYDRADTIGLARTESEPQSNLKLRPLLVGSRTNQKPLGGCVCCTVQCNQLDLHRPRSMTCRRTTSP